MKIEDLIDNIIKTYPNKLPTTIKTEAEVARLIGQQDVIKYIVSVYEEITRKTK